MNVAVFQPKGKGHIKYIHGRALEIYRRFYKSEKSRWIDALQAAMRDHRNYLISATRAEEKKEKKIKIKPDIFWKENGVWKLL